MRGLAFLLRQVEQLNVFSPRRKTPHPNPPPMRTWGEGTGKPNAMALDAHAASFKFFAIIPIAISVICDIRIFALTDCEFGAGRVSIFTKSPDFAFNK